ncbi:hypothetical protein TWF281_004241 [Arthrobotrys megalospora]
MGLLSFSTHTLLLLSVVEVQPAPLAPGDHEHAYYPSITIEGNYTGGHEYPHYPNRTTHGSSTDHQKPAYHTNVAIQGNSTGNSASESIPNSTAIAVVCSGFLKNPACPLKHHDSNSTSLSSANEALCVNCKNGAVGPKNAKTATETSPDKATKRVKKELISPNFFYEGGKAKVKCSSPGLVWQIEPYENDLGFPLDKWPDWKAEYETKKDARVAIQFAQDNCKRACDCDEQGAIVPRKYAGRHACSEIFQANRCSIALELIQPTATSQTASRQDYQDALDRIPQTIRNENPNYWWEMHGLAVPRRPWDFMGWSRDPNENPVDVTQPLPWTPDAGWRRYQTDIFSEPPRGPLRYPWGLRPGELGEYGGKGWKRDVNSDDNPKESAQIGAENDGGANGGGTD